VGPEDIGDRRIGPPSKGARNWGDGYIKANGGDVMGRRGGKIKGDVEGAAARLGGEAVF
jgi:hypothetical protein